MHPEGESPCPCWKLHGGGPWLIIYGRGPESEDTATRLAEQCTAHSVWFELTPIDEVNQNDVRPGYYPGLVAVLPSQVTNPTADLKPFSDLIGNYRARRPETFKSIRTRGRRWFYAGVVHLVGKPEIIQNSLLVATLDSVCAQHCADDSDPVNIFQLYTRPSSTLTEPSSENNIERLLRYVHTWGIARDDVPKLRKCIDDCRERFENHEMAEDKPHYPALFRPLQPNREKTPDQAWELNMLDIILLEKKRRTSKNRSENVSIT